MKTKLGRLIFVGAQSFGTLRLSRFRAAQHAAAPGGRRAVGERPQVSAKLSRNPFDQHRSSAAKRHPTMARRNRRIVIASHSPVTIVRRDGQFCLAFPAHQSDESWCAK